MDKRYECPKCHSEALEVRVECWAALLQTEDGNVMTSVDSAMDQSEEWGENSLMQCLAEGCGFEAIAEEFEIGEETDDEI